MSFLSKAKAIGSGGANMMELMPKVMGIIGAIMAKDRAKLSEEAKSFLTPDNVHTALSNFSQFYIDRQNERGAKVRYRVMLTTDNANAEVVLMIYECEGGNNTPVLEKPLSQVNEQEINYLIDAILSMVFPA